MDVYVAEQLARTFQPSIADVYTKWNTTQRILQKVPEHAPPVFVGDRLLFYALFDETMPFDHTTTVELFAGSQQQPIGMARIDYVPPVLNSQAITRLAAKARLRELLIIQQSNDKESMVNLSIKYGILCPYTAFIGVEKRLNANNESNADMELREVPILINDARRNVVRRFCSSSYAYPQLCQSLSADINSIRSIMQYNIDQVLERSEKIDDLVARSQDLCISSKTFSRKVSRTKGFSVNLGSVTQPVVNFFSSFFNRKNTEEHVISSICDSIDESLDNSKSFSSQTAEIAWPTDEQKLVDRFIELQQYDGLWMLTTDDVNQLTSKPLTAFSSTAIENVEKNQQQLVITTTIVIVLLETRCLSTKTLWQALSNKALKRLKELLKEDETKLEQLMKDIRDQLQ